jgi:hypothetical protein
MVIYDLFAPITNAKTHPARISVTFDYYWLTRLDGNIQTSIHLADRTPLPQNPATTEDGHLESDYEDRVSGTDG